MPVTDFSSTNSGIVLNGRWFEQFTNLIIPSTNSFLYTITTGTQVRVHAYCDGTTLRWTVDGGSEQTFTTPVNNDLEWITLYTGLSDAGHTINLYAAGYVDKVNTLEVTGAAPAVADPTGYSNNQFLVYGVTGISTDNSVIGSTSSYPNFVNRGSVRFKATTDTIRVWTSGIVGLVTDGDVNSIVHGAAPSTTWGWVSFTGLDGAAEHTYRLIINGFAYSIMLPTGTLNTTALTPFPADFWQGDSTMNGTAIPGGWADATPNFPQYFGIKLNRGWQIEATSGGTAVTTGVAQKADPGASVPTPAAVWIGWGINDQVNGSGGLSAWDSAVTTIITKINGDLPTVPVRWYGIIPESGTNANRGSYNSGLQAAIAAYANPNVIYVSTDGLTITGDGTHPDAAGCVTVANALIASLVSISVSETTLERGQASQTLHVTMTGATSTSISDWTIAVGGTSGTVTAIGGTASNPILTVTAPAANGTATLTYTPNTATTTIAVQDTTAPASTSVTLGTVSSYGFTLSWTAVSPSPAGETITYNVKKNGSVVSSGESGTTYAVTGAVDGDVFAVEVLDNSGNASAYASTTFHKPSSGGGGSIALGIGLG